MRTRRLPVPFRFSLLALLAAILIALMAAPRPALASDFDVDRVDVQAQVQDNGDLIVTEMRTFSFTDDINGVYWDIPLAVNEQGSRSDIQVLGVAYGTAGSGAQPYSQVGYANVGDDGVYTVTDEGDNVRLQVFSQRADGEQGVFSVTYRLSGAVMAWGDTAELYWQFVGPDWDEDSNDVTLAVTFAGAAAGTPATTGTDSANFRAWGHGPLDGTVSLDAAVPSVTLTAPRVRSGQFAEVRVAFPLDWVPGLAASSAQRLPDILEEETQWADKANREREVARTLVTVANVLQVGVPAVFLAVVAVLRFTRGRSPKPVFDETYFRDVPSADHPAVISAFMDGGEPGDKAFVATLMKLTDDRVIGLSAEEYERKRLIGSKTETTYRIDVLNAAGATDEIDRLALKLYFGEHFKDGDEADFDDLKRMAKDHPKRYTARLDDYKAQVRADLEMRNLIESNGLGFKITVLALAILLGVVSGGHEALVDGATLPALFASLAMLVAACVLAVGYRRYSQEGVELKARCAALKKWLEDFTRLGEAVPADLILWNKLLVLAVALGVSDEVLRQLADAVPAELRENEYGGYYYPVYWWCYPHAHLGSPASVMHTAYAATVAELSTSSNSSGGGFGGGFSGGGGGGVGGGGGGSF